MTKRDPALRLAAAFVIATVVTLPITFAINAWLPEPVQIFLASMVLPLSLLLLSDRAVDGLRRRLVKRSEDRLVEDLAREGHRHGGEP